MKKREEEKGDELLDRKVNEEVDQDPETLLRASLSVFHRLYKKGHKEPEQIVLMKMLVDYIRSLKDDDD